MIQRKTAADHYQVSTRTISEDIGMLKSFFADIDGQGIGGDIVYSREIKGFLLERKYQSWLTHHEILAITRVLLESRAFTKAEIEHLLDKLIKQSVPNERVALESVIGNERFHYIPPKHNLPLIQRIWDLSEAVREKRLVKLVYKKERAKVRDERTVEAWGIVFSEYYFYLIGYIHGKNYEFPAVYRLDRICDESKVLDAHFQVPESRRFEEGEFRKRVQFMKAGRLLRIQFRFWGDSLDAVLDRLPTARVIRREENAAVVEAEVFGAGIKMWLLSQAEHLEVIGPKEFREEMQKTIEAMLGNYIYSER